MKKLFKEYTHFSKVERMGLTTMISLIFLLFVAWQTIPYCYAAPEEDAAENKQLAIAWESYKKTHLKSGEPIDDATSSNIQVQLKTFDPNTLDSVGFLQLGLSPKVVKGLINWRRHGKKFYKKEDLKPLYNLSEADYARLEPYISISVSKAYELHHYSNCYAKLPPLPATLDLNTTDSATIVRLNGIGPTLAHKIIMRRNALGGFLKHEQLLEVYKFDDTTFAMLRQKLVIRPEAIRKISINTATLEQLQAHPYLGEKMAKNILLLRNGLKRYENIRQLRQVPLMNEEIYRKIAPYLVID